MPRRHPLNPRPQRRPEGPWRNGPIPVIGLVGGIGAGKSLAASALAARGAFLLDADAIGHILLDQSPCRDRVLDRFGEGVLEPFAAEEGIRRPINRRALGTIAFANRSALRDLELILHPAMRKTFEKAIARESRRQRHPAIVLDAAILYEADWDSLCDLVVCVDADPDRRMARLEATRGWTAEVLASREKSQGPIEEKRRDADHVLTNDGTPEELLAAIDALWPRLLKPSGRRSGAGRGETSSASKGQSIP